MRRKILALVLLGSIVSSQAFAGFWCSQAKKFEGQCYTCNSLCAIEMWFTSLGGWSD